MPRAPRSSTKRVRIVDVDPTELADTVTKQVAETTLLLYRALIGKELTEISNSPVQGPLHEAVTTVAEYATSGRGSAKAVRNRLRVIELAVGSAEFENDAGAQSPGLDDPLWLVMSVAETRLALADDAMISGAQLAQLASVYPQHIAKLVRQGLLRPDRRGRGPALGQSSSSHMFTADSARAWLAARGVPGFERYA